MTTSLGVSAATVVAVVTIGTSYAVSSGGELGPFGVYGPPAWALPVVPASGVLSATGAWVTRSRRPATSSGLALATAAVLLPFWAGWDWLPASVRSGALAVSPLAVAGVARAVVGLSPHRPTALVRSSLRAVLLLAAVAVLVRLAGYDPFSDPGCVRVCENVEPLLGGTLTSHAAVMTAAVLTSCAAGVARPGGASGSGRSTPYGGGGGSRGTRHAGGRLRVAGGPLG